MPNKKVLIVDDCPDVRALFTKRFEHLGATITTAIDGASALEAVSTAAQEKSPFTLIMLDIRMPGMSGFTVAEQIRNAGFKGVIALCTSIFTGEGRTEGKAVGVDFCFDKAHMKPEVFAALLDKAAS